MTAKISVLGGSSPFTAALIDALADDRQGVPAATLQLHGRTRAALELVAAYARRHLSGLGWQVSVTTELDTALEGADIIVHQVRYGGLAGRMADEQLAAGFSIPPDETLGPAGLQAALRAANELRELAASVQRVAPRAWLLNLTNPLSVATALLSERVGPKCVGLCELPWQTVRTACNQLSISPHQATWHYAGLNHRGFVYHLSSDGDDLIQRLAGLPPSTLICGMSRETILELNAIPLKYFRLMLGQEVLVAGRAQALVELREQILSELAEDLGKSPPSLALRQSDWYGLSVVPVIASILRNDGGRHVVNVHHAGLVREIPVEVYSDRMTPVRQPPPGPQVQAWLDRFAEHESAVLAAMHEPSTCRIAEAVRLDPLTPARKAAQVTERLVARWSPSTTRSS